MFINIGESQMKNLSIALMVFCFGFFLYAEWAVYQHYLIINSDYYPVMSEFYKMYAVRFGNLIAQLAGIQMGYRIATIKPFAGIAEASREAGRRASQSMRGVAA